MSFRVVSRMIQKAPLLGALSSSPCSAQRPKTARARGEAREVLHGHVLEAPLSHGSRPPCLGELRGPQDKYQMHTVEQFADDVPMLTLLVSPVPQKVKQLVAVLARFDAPDPEQVIELPKISLPPRFSSKNLTPQMAAQLVEVPVPSVLEVTIMAPFAEGSPPAQGGI